MKNKVSKKIIICIAAAVLALVLIIVLALSLRDKPNNEDPAEDSSAVAVNNETAVETEPETGDGEIDPENNEITEEDGADVKAEDLQTESGRSNGIDVSKWQGKIDWKAVKDSGIEFAYIRIGYRGENGNIYKDDNADYNIQQAQKNGILVGVYFFSTAVDTAEAVEEANWTLSQIKGYSISYPVVYDCEGFKLSSSRMYNVTNAERTENSLAFMNTIESAGYEAMLYAARNDLAGNAYWETSKFEDTYKVWVAQYPAKTYPQTDRPDYSGRCDAWQYTNKGTVAGIEGNVDMVVCYFERELASPKDPSLAPSDAKTPLTTEEMNYEAVDETVTAKELVNLRSSATTKSDVVGTLKNGETLKRIGIGSNGWSKLEYNGKIVYAISSYLTTNLSPNEPDNGEDILAGHTFTPCADLVTAKDIVNLRALPTTESEIVGTLRAGTFLECTATSNKGWSRLTYNGKTVYAVTSYLTTEDPTKKEPVYEGYEEVNEQVTAKVETNLRTAPNTESSEVVYTLKNGEYVQRIGVNPNGWSKLIYNGQTVYAKSSYLTNAALDEDGFETVDEQVTAKVETNLRTAPNTENSEVVYTLKNGEYVHRIGVSHSGWSKLEYNGKILYALTSYLTEEEAE